jgi:hypothetical protein
MDRGREPLARLHLGLAAAIVAFAVSHSETGCAWSLDTVSRPWWRARSREHWIQPCAQFVGSLVSWPMWVSMQQQRLHTSVLAGTCQDAERARQIRPKRCSARLECFRVTRMHHPRRPVRVTRCQAMPRRAISVRFRGGRDTRMRRGPATANMCCGRISGGRHRHHGRPPGACRGQVRWHSGGGAPHLADRDKRTAPTRWSIERRRDANRNRSRTLGATSRDTSQPRVASTTCVMEEAALRHVIGGRCTEDCGSDPAHASGAESH